MRRECISLGDIYCDGCHHLIPYSQRYLAIDEEDGVEVEKGKTVHYCVECALQKDYAKYKEDKGERTVTFSP